MVCVLSACSNRVSHRSEYDRSTLKLTTRFFWGRNRGRDERVKGKEKLQFNFASPRQAQPNRCVACGGLCGIPPYSTTTNGRQAILQVPSTAVCLS